MTARQVEITYARSGVKAIHVDGEELDIRYIEDKSIESWFEPAHERRSSWKGLAEELWDKVGDENAVFSFDFFGPEESRTIFFRCLEEHGLGNAELSQEDIIRRHLENARKAENREQYHMAFQAYKNAAVLGSPEGQFSLGEWYARILDFQPGLVEAQVLHLDEKWSRPALDHLFPGTLPGMKEAAERIAAEALDCYEQAAKQGYVPAQKMLYDLLWGYDHKYWYAEIPRSEEEAVRWLTAAAESGDEEAEERLERYHEEKRLAEERILAAAERLDAERSLEEARKRALEQLQQIIPPPEAKQPVDLDDIDALLEPIDIDAAASIEETPQKADGAHKVVLTDAQVIASLAAQGPLGLITVPIYLTLRHRMNKQRKEEEKRKKK